MQPQSFWMYYIFLIGLGYLDKMTPSNLIYYQFKGKNKTQIRKLYGSLKKAVVPRCHLLFISYSYDMCLIIYLVKHLSSYVKLIMLC